MTPPAATAAARTYARPTTRPTRPQAPRRVSGPAPKRRSGAPAAAAPALGLRLARRAVTLPDARVLDRLARGRLWIGMLAVGLVGIVFLQITLLKLNTGISRAVQTGQTLERQNTALKLDLSRLGGGERVQDSARARGFVLPATGQPRFLDARKASATRAAESLSAPAPIAQLPLGMIEPALGGTAGLTPDPVATPSIAPPAAGTTAPAPAAAATGVAATVSTPAPTTPAVPAATPAPVAAAPVTPAPVAATQTPPPATAAPPATAGGAAAPQG